MLASQDTSRRASKFERAQPQMKQKFCSCLVEAASSSRSWENVSMMMPKMMLSSSTMTTTKKSRSNDSRARNA